MAPLFMLGVGVCYGLPAAAVAGSIKLDLFIVGMGVAALGGLSFWLARKIIRSSKRRWWYTALEVVLFLLGVTCLIFGGALVCDSFSALELP